MTHKEAIQKMLIDFQTQKLKEAAIIIRKYVNAESPAKEGFRPSLDQQEARAWLDWHRNDKS